MLARLKTLSAHRTAPLVLGLLSAALLIPALFGGFQLDDHFQRYRLLGLGEPSIELFVFYDGDPDRNRAQMESGMLPWFAHPNLRHANLRYLSVLTMQLDYLLWPNSPLLMHLHSLLWLVALVAVALVVYRRLLPVWLAGIAGLLYAIDDAHSLPAAYLANRNALIATFFGLACLYCHVRWRRDGWKPGRWLGPLCLALGLLAGELAISAVAFVGSFALTLERGSLREKALSLLPNALVSVSWFAAHRIGGFGSEGSGFYVDPFREPLDFLTLVVDRALVLLLGQWTPFPADWAALTELGTAAASGFRISGCLLIGLLAVLFARAQRTSAECRFFALGSLLSLAPICAVGPQNRLLFFVGFGAFGMLGCLAKVAFTDSGTRLHRFGFAALLVVHMVLAPLVAYLFLDLQNSAARKMEVASASLPDEGLASKTVVLVNPPDSVYSTLSIPFLRLNEGLPKPSRIRMLAHGSSEVRLLRETDRTLRVDLDEGLFPDTFSRYFRSSDLGFSLEDVFSLEGFSAEILAVNDLGDPESIRYTFDTALEDQDLLFLTWDGDVFSPWSPVPVGATVEFPAQGGLFN